jgi:single-stranded DNA-binding protein
LKKGAIVSVYGRLYLNQYKTQDGEPHANIACHANTVKVVAKGGSGKAEEAATAGTGEDKSDLPF